MKTKIKVALGAFCIVMIFLVTGCNNTSKNTKTGTEEHHSKVQYTCTMHPEVIQNEPGNCAKCGMKLVEKTVDDHNEHSHDGHNH